MIFFSPLLLILLAIIPLLILAALILTSFRERRISSVLFHRRLVEKGLGKRSGALPIDLLLLLQILVILLLVIAAADPRVPSAFPNTSGSADDMIILLDDTASMGAEEEGGTRFEAARAYALELIDRKGPEDAVTLVTASSPPRLISPPETDLRVLRSLIRSAYRTDLGNGHPEALLLARSEGGGRTVILTDGAFSMDREELGNAEIRIFSSPAENAGITEFGITQVSSAAASPTAPGRYHIFAEITSYFRERTTLAYELSRNGDRLVFDSAVLAPGESTALSRSFRVPPGEEAEIVLKLLVDDGLETDNTARAVIGPSRVRTIGLLTPENPFLAAALGSLPAAEVLPLDSAGHSRPGDFDLLVYDRLPPPSGFPAAVPRGGGTLRENPPALYIDTVGGTELSGATITDWDESVPFLQGTDLRGIYVLSVRIPGYLPGYRPAVFAENTPLLFVRDEGGPRSVYVCFDFLESDFPVRTAFPQLLAAFTDWAVGDVSRRKILLYRTGERVPEHLLGEEDSAGAGVPVFTSAGAGPVNLLDRNESDITNRLEAQTLDRDGNGEIIGTDKSPGGDDPHYLPIQRYIIYAALVLLLLEGGILLLGSRGRYLR
jgi:hypothetical protein